MPVLWTCEKEIKDTLILLKKVKARQPSFERSLPCEERLLQQWEITFNDNSTSEMGACSAAFNNT